MQILTEREQGGHTNVRQNKFKATRLQETKKETESVLRNFSTKQSPRTDGLTSEFEPTFKELIPILLSFPKC